MQTSELGCSGIPVTRLSLGTWNMAGGEGWGPQDDAKAVDLIRYAVETGCNFIDTARGYGQGHAERLVGEALEGQRDDVIIATKMLHCTPDEVEKQLEESLECLRTDYVDLYICHWPIPRLPLEPFFEELVRLREAGRIRALGVSNFDLHQMEVARRFGVVSLQPPFSILWRIPVATMGYCQDKGIAVTSYSSLAQGLLTGRFSHGGLEKIVGIRQRNKLFEADIAPDSIRVARLVDGLAADHGCTSSQVALAWLLRTPGMTAVIVGASRREQWDDNLGAMDVTLTDKEYDMLDREGRSVWEKIGPDQSMWGWKPS